MPTSTTVESQRRHPTQLLQELRVERFREFLKLRNRGNTSQWAWFKLVESDAVFQQPILPFSHHELVAVTHTSTRRIKGAQDIARDADSLRTSGHGLSIGADLSLLAPDNERGILQTVVGENLLMAPALLQFSYRGPDSPILHRHLTHCAVKIRFPADSSKMKSIDLCFDSKCMISTLISLKLLPFPVLPQYIMCTSARDAASAQPLIAACGMGASQVESGQRDSSAE